MKRSPQWATPKLLLAGLARLYTHNSKFKVFPISRLDLNIIIENPNECGKSGIHVRHIPKEQRNCLFYRSMPLEIEDDWSGSLLQNAIQVLQASG